MSALLAAFDAKYNPPVPPYSKILEVYEQDDPQHHLRLGQWFFNRYLRRMTLSKEIDTLYNSTDFDVIFNIIEKYYRDYQWPMA